MDPAVYSIAEFCAAHRVSRSMFYKLRAQGLAPRLMQVGTRWIISKEAAADWRREREAANSPRSRTGFALRQPVDTTQTRVA